jgi:hypothetical protein
MSEVEEQISAVENNEDSAIGDADIVEINLTVR